MAQWNDLLDLSSLEQARLIQEKKISSEELTKLYLERIEALNPTLSAFVEVWPKDALKVARQKDALVKEGAPLQAFHGVPMGIKDLGLVRGRWTRFGSRSTAIFAPFDCKTTASLRRAGFVFLGKTATSEFGALPVTEPDIHGPTRNPWDTQMTAGGSSGGAAAAVSAALLPAAHASDGGGSIRIPGALCGLFGMKPSRGRVPNQYGLNDKSILYTCGPLTRTVADAAAMLDAMSGLDIPRPHWLTPPPETFSALLVKPAKKQRICIFLKNQITEVHPEIKSAVYRVARVLESKGHYIEETKMPDASANEFLPIWQKLISQAPVFFSSRLQPTTRWLREEGAARDAKEVHLIRERLMERVYLAGRGFDIFLTPSVPVPAPEIGAWRGLSPAQTFEHAAKLAAFTGFVNLTGQPAVTIPAGLREGRWPIGVQLVARTGEEATLFSLSQQLEEALPWRNRWSPLAKASTDKP